MIKRNKVWVLLFVLVLTACGKQVMVGASVGAGAHRLENRVDVQIGDPATEGALAENYVPYKNDNHNGYISIISEQYAGRSVRVVVERANSFYARVDHPLPGSTPGNERRYGIDAGYDSKRGEYYSIDYPLHKYSLPFQENLVSIYMGSSMVYYGWVKVVPDTIFQIEL